MMKCLITFVFAFACYANTIAQSITVRDSNGIVVTGDTIEISPEITQKPPYTNIQCRLYAQNISGNTMNLGVKKAEITPDPDADHGICFYKYCYPTNVYVAPDVVPLSPSGIDSSFKGTYLYLAGNHTPGKYLVAYTFFNHDNPADSAIVYVYYNTNITTGIANTTLQNNIGIYPNPAKDIVHLSSPSGMNGTLTITNSMGAVVYKQTLVDLRTASIPTSSWAEGIYYYDVKEIAAKGRFVIQ